LDIAGDFKLLARGISLHDFFFSVGIGFPFFWASDKTEDIANLRVAKWCFTIFTSSWANR
jgi:hypothetical protein